MGYRTWYKLNIKPEPSQELLNELLDDLTIDEIVDGFESKWYTYDSDMIELSVKYPDYVFTLSGEGDSSDDIWRAFYKSGKSYHWRLDYNIPEFDESKLE
jgi:hypothetical protein